MCWACDMDGAMALLANSKQVLEEAETLRKYGSQIQAQAYGESYRAELRREEDSSICKEIEDACEVR